MMLDESVEFLTNTQWQIAHDIARDLIESDADVNELGKAIAYLRSAINQDPSKAGTQFFKFLQTLVRNGNQIGHSGRTIGYYRTLDKVVGISLKKEEANAQNMLKILGWVARLMRYYKVTPIGEIPDIEFTEEETEFLTERQLAIEKLKSEQAFKEGQIIEAVVDKKYSKGNKVTYVIEGIAFTEKERKTFNSIPESGIVKVQIKSLKEDGSINHVKFTDV